MGRDRVWEAKGVRFIPQSISESVNCFFFSLTAGTAHTSRADATHYIWLIKKEKKKRKKSESVLK